MSLFFVANSFISPCISAMKGRNIFWFIPLVLSSFTGVSVMQGQALSPEEFRDALDPYVGLWQGEYRIFSQEDDLLNQFKVNRNYWWDGSVLLGRVSYDFGELKQTFFHRIILSDGVPFSFVTDSVNASEVRSALKGELLKGTLVWSRVMPRGSLPVRISERIVKSEDGRFIEFWGNQEAKDAQGASFLVRIEGFAAYLPDSRDFVVATEDLDPSGLDASQAFQSETAGPDDASEVADRARRLQALDPDRRSASGSQPVTPPEVTPGSKPSNREELEEPTPVETISVPETVVIPDLEVEQLPVQSQPEPEEDPSITAALQSLNVVGIQDKPGEQCIVVDYFLLYEIGDDLNLTRPCVFVGVDEQYLYFEGDNGYRYRLFRKDVLPQ